MKFQNIIKELRSKEGITQTELSSETKIPKSTIAKYEHGQLEANYKRLNIIADFFNVSIDYLLGREIKRNTTNANILSDQQKTLLSNFNNLKDYEQAQVLGYIQGLSENKLNQNKNKGG
jgi:transcriptional regulator with XRE-family HTH domain